MTTPPKLSVAIATLNEGPDLEVTIATSLASKFTPHEVIVCDDYSKEDPTPRLAGWTWRKPPVRMIRNPYRMGSGPTKSRALEACEGDVAIILDSHMRLHYQTLGQIAQAHVEHPTAILCAESTGFFLADGFYGQGARLRMHPTSGVVASWNGSGDFEPSDPYPTIIALHGGCYAIPRPVLAELGGYAPLLKGYGLEEEWVAMRAAAKGIETRLVKGCPVAHQYKRIVSRESFDEKQPDNRWEMPYNRHVIHRWAFGDEQYEKTYRDFLYASTPEPARARVQEELRKSEPYYLTFVSQHPNPCTHEEMLDKLGLPQHPKAPPEQFRLIEGEPCHNESQRERRHHQMAGIEAGKIVEIGPKQREASGTGSKRAV